MYTRKLFSGAMLLATMCVLAACEPGDGRRVDTAAGTVDINDNINVTEVELGRAIGADKKVVNDLDTFAPGDTIYASVRLNGNGSPATLTAKWVFDDSVTVQEQNQPVAPTRDDTWTEFHMTKSTPWPKGKYKVVVLVNGKEVETESFTVK